MKKEKSEYNQKLCTKLPKLPEDMESLEYFWMYLLKGEWCNTLSLYKLTSLEMAEDWLLERFERAPTQKKLKWALCVKKVSITHEVVSYHKF